MNGVELLASTFSDTESATTTDALLTQREAADLLKVSVSYLRSSCCPKVLLPGTGPRGRPLVRYLRSDVLNWALSRRI